VKKYIDDAIQYIKAEMHEVIDNNHDQILTREDRSMSDGNILAKLIHRPEPQTNLDVIDCFIFNNNVHIDYVSTS